VVITSGPYHENKLSNAKYIFVPTIHLVKPHLPIIVNEERPARNSSFQSGQQMVREEQQWWLVNQMYATR
jgi:hypothetical protein